MNNDNDGENLRSTNAGSTTHATPGFIHKTVIVFGIGALFLLAGALLWNASQVLLMDFAVMLVAILLRDAGDQVRRVLPISPRTAIVIVLIVVLAALVAGAWLLAPQIGDQVMQLLRALPEALQRVRDYLRSNPVLQHVVRWLPQPEQLAGTAPAVATQAGNLFSGALGSLANFVIILFVGIYLAMQPEPYTGGVIKLLPQHRRQRGGEVLRELGETLTYWLRGKLFSMLAIGVTTGVGLYLIGVPLALALGVVAGLLDFIPYLGPILAAIPAVLIAFPQGVSQVVYVIVLFFFLQMLEGYLLLPLVERRTVSLPPALNITMQILLGLPFGLLGVALATPMTAVLIVLVEMLYVQDVLEDRVSLPSDRQ